MKNIIVKINDAVQTVQQVNLVTNDGQATVIKAAKNVNYQFIDQATGRGPDHIITKRVGKDLHVSLEDEGQETDLIIEDFYDNDAATLIGEAENGQFYYYLPDTGEVADYVTQLAIGDVEGQALGGNPVAAPWWLGATEAKAAIWPWLIGGLLGAGGIAALASDDDDKPVADTTADKPNLTPNNDGSVTAKPGNDNTKVDVKYTDENGVEHTSTITKGKDGNWTSTDPNLVVDPKTGIITIPADKVKDGSEVTAKGTDDKGNEATRTTTAGNNPTTPETDTTADKPDLTPNDDGSITVKPGPDNTKVVVKYTDEDGNPKEATLTKDKDGNWTSDNPDLVKNQDGTFTIPADKVKDGSDVNAKGTDDKGNMADADKAIAGNNPASEPEQPTDTKIPGDSNNDGKVDGDDDSNNEVKLPNGKTVPRNTDGAPNIVFGEDTNQDGTLNKTEIGDDQSTPVYVTIPDNTEEGDKVIVTINGKDQEIPVTAEMLKDGFTTVDVPTTDLSEIKVTAKVTNPDGSQSSNEATATAKVDTTADTPEVLANDDGSVTITPKGDNIKVEVKYTDEDGKEHTATITKGEDGKWTSNDPALTTDPESGKTTIPPKQVEFNTPVIATSTDDNGNTATKTVTAKDDADKPTLADDNGSITVTPGEDNTEVVVKFTDENGEPQKVVVKYDSQSEKWAPEPEDDDRVIISGPGKDATFTIPAELIEDGSKVGATGINNHNTPAEAEPASVGNNPDTTADKPILTAKDDGSVTVKPGPDNTKVEVTYIDADDSQKEVTLTKDKDGNWSTDNPDLVKNQDGTFTIPADKVKDGSDVNARGTDDKDNTADADKAVAVDNIPGDSNYNGKIDGDDDSGKEITLPNGQKVPVNTDGAPNIIFGEDANNDGKLNKEELGSKDPADKTLVYITIPDNTEAGDTVHIKVITPDGGVPYGEVREKDVVLTKDDIAKGYIEESVPVTKDSDITVTAKVTDSTGQSSGEGSKTVSVDSKIPGDSNNDGKLDDTDDSDKKVELPNGQKVPANDNGAPNIVFGEDKNDDGKLNKEELGSKDPADKTPVYITIPDNTEAGDTVHVKVTTPDGKTTEKDVVLTQEDIAKGYIEESVPVAKDQDGDITVTAKVTDPAGNTSGEGKKTVSVDTKIPGDTNGDGKVDDNDDSGKEVELPNGQKVPANENGAPNIVFGEDGNLDGKLNKQELGSKDGEETTPVYITIPDKTEVGDTIKVTITTPEGPETKEIPVTAEMLKDGFTTVDVPVKQDGEIKVTAKVEDPAGNTSAEGSSAVTVDTSVVPVVPPTPEKTTTPTVDVSNKDTDGNGADDKTTISGKTDPNADVTVTLPDGSTQTTKADKDGKYSVDVPVLKEGDKVEVVAKAPEKTPSDKGTGTVPAVHTEPTPTDPMPTEPTPEPAGVDNKDGKGVQTTTPKNEGEELVTTVKLTNENGNPSLSFAQPNGTKPGELGKDDFDKPEFSNGVTQNPDGTLKVPAGVKEFTITTPVKADNVTEGPETGKFTVGGVEGNEVTVNDTSNDPAVPPTPPANDPNVVAEGNGGAHVIPGPDNTEVKVTFTDEDEKPQEVTIVKGADDTWTLKEGTTKPAGVKVESDGTVTIDPEAVKDKSEVKAEGTNGDPAAKPGMDKDTTTDDNIPANVDPKDGKGVVTTPDTTDEGTNFVTTVKLTNNNGNKNLPFELPNGTGEGQLGKDDFDKSEFSKDVTLNEDGTLNVPAGVKEFTITTPVKADNVTEGVEKGKFKVGGIDGNEVTVKDTSTNEVKPTIDITEISGDKQAAAAKDDGSAAGDVYAQISPAEAAAGFLVKGISQNIKGEVTVTITEKGSEQVLATAKAMPSEKGEWTVTFPANALANYSQTKEYSVKATGNSADGKTATDIDNTAGTPQVTDIKLHDNLTDEPLVAGKYQYSNFYKDNDPKFVGDVTSAANPDDAVNLATGLTNDKDATLTFTLDKEPAAGQTVKVYRYTLSEGTKVVTGADGKPVEVKEFTEFDKNDVSADLTHNGLNYTLTPKGDNVLGDTFNTSYRYKVVIEDKNGDELSTSDKGTFDFRLDTLVEQMSVEKFDPATGEVVFVPAGLSEVEATIEYRYTAGTGKTDWVKVSAENDGKYHLSLPNIDRKVAGTLELRVTDAAGNVSESKVSLLRNLFSDLTTDGGPLTNPDKDFDQSLITNGKLLGKQKTGTAEQGAITATDGNDTIIVGLDYKPFGGFGVSNGSLGSTVGYDLKVDLGAGDDSLQFRGTGQSMNAGLVATGSGSDRISLERGFVIGTYSFDLGKGVDQAGDTNILRVGGDIVNAATTNIYGGDGNDTIDVGGDYDGTKNIDLGEGNNTLRVGYGPKGGNDLVKKIDFTTGSGDDVISVKGDISTIAGQKQAFNLGDGDNLVEVGNNVDTDGTFTFGNGNDTMNIKGTLAGGTIEFGDGNDSLTVDSIAKTGADNVKINFGAGDDSLTITGSQVNTAQGRIDGGEGNDTLVLRGEDLNLDYSQVLNFETIDMRAIVGAIGNQTVSLTLDDLQREGDTVKELYIKGDVNDTVDFGRNGEATKQGGNGAIQFKDSGGALQQNWNVWEKTDANIVKDGVVYDKYQYQGSTGQVNDEVVYIQQGIQII
ncbi:hypothetical protein ACFBZI_01100 [Moraxella sp. ZJ142]|uniref:hypothetical protein n=1 Tax=Moraxella marmotae TaxID=3344520 RepID=UPI0035D4D5F9